MNYFKIATVILLSSIVSLYACKEDTSSDDEETSETTEQNSTKPADVSDIKAPTNPTMPTNPSTPPATMPATAEPAQNADGVWHYTCSNGCAGGAGSAVPCGTCGNQLAHNAAYHAGAAQNAPGMTAPGQNPQAPAITAPGQNMPEPPQNAKGVWHYTCTQGCPGGAGSATPCNSCGATLAHNAVYHQ